MTPFHPRIGNHVNWYGLWTLYCREVMVTVKFAGHTLLAPMVTGLLFLAVFSLALGGDERQVAGTPFLLFLGPGLVMMGALVALGVLALIILPALDIPRLSKAERKESGRPLTEIARQPVFIVAASAAMIGYGVMSLIMTATPLAM